MSICYEPLGVPGAGGTPVCRRRHGPGTLGSHGTNLPADTPAVQSPTGRLPITGTPGLREGPPIPVSPEERPLPQRALGSCQAATLTQLPARGCLPASPQPCGREINTQGTVREQLLPLSRPSRSAFRGEGWPDNGGRCEARTPPGLQISDKRDPASFCKVGGGWKGEEPGETIISPTLKS